MSYDFEEIEEVLKRSLPSDFEVARTEEGFDIYSGQPGPLFNLHYIKVGTMTFHPKPKLTAIELPFPLQFWVWTIFPFGRWIHSTLTRGFVAGCLRIAAGMGPLEKVVGQKIEAPGFEVE